MRLNPQVEFAEPNFLIEKSDLTPNDPSFDEQWALENTGQNGGQFGSDMDASAAWQTTTGSQSTIVAVIDSGVDFTHPDLANNQWTNPAPSTYGDLNGWDYISDSGTVRDEQGHGTAIAGIIAAQGNNGIGLSGVMWNASLMSLRVLDNTGTGDVADAVEAIDYAALYYNSLVWTRDGSYIKFNADLGSPAPGFRLSLPKVQQIYYDYDSGTYSQMLVTSSGGRVELRQTAPSSTIFESIDGSYTQMDVSTAPNGYVTIKTSDGTQMKLQAVSVNNESRCTEIKDRNGNPDYCILQLYQRPLANDYRHSRPRDYVCLQP